jgi:uncharacterized SAM-binding protein YcdF (DUF218 family)
MIPIIKAWLRVLSEPLVLAALIAAAGALCRWRRRCGLARWLVASAAMVAYLGASPIVGDALIGPLERAYPPLREVEPLPAVGYIVVLGTGYTPRDGVPVTAALSQAGLVRIVEGIRLMRGMGVAKLVVSGGAPPGLGRSALGYAELARDLGVPESSLVILDEPQNTAAEARTVRRTLGDAPFILVTSAAHMPRAMRLMQLVGAHPIPAPTGQLVEDSSFQWEKLIPNSGGLHKVESALHEYVGLAVLAAGFDGRPAGSD